MLRSLVSLSFILLCFGCQAESKNLSEAEFAALRQAMVRTQIEGRGIKDSRVLDVLRRVPRHRFVPERLAGQAYNDHPLPIGEGQTISQPYIVAFMTEILAIREHDKVLEIGTGSGYQAAVLAELCDSVFTIEIVPALAKRSKKLLKGLKYNNVLVYEGDGFAGIPEHAPYDKIMVTCAPPSPPQPLIDQLKEGGSMIIPVGDYFQELKLLTKKEGKVTEKAVLPVRFVPMTGKMVKQKGK